MTSQLELAGGPDCLTAGLRRRLARRRESGYVLGVVLAAMVIGLSLITALLGLSFTTQRAAIVQQELARERRAADGTLEAGLAGVLANTANAADPCDASNVPSTVDMDVDGDSATEEKVGLVCEPIIDPDPAADGKMVVVGDRSSWTWPSSPPTGVGLVHTGDEPVRFAGDVDVRGTGAAKVLPNGPGMVVAGRYAQGEACSGATTPGSGEIRTTEEAGPVCPSPGAAAVTGTASVESPPDEPALQYGAAYVGGKLGAGCQDATFGPGRYLPDAVEALNDRFDDNCDATYIFSPGTYWFDGAYDTVSRDSVIIFADPGSNFVFGDQKPGAVPPTCDPGPSAGKAKVVLSGATTFRHTGGNVSICGSLTQARRTYSKPRLTLVESNLNVPANIFAKPTVVASTQEWPHKLGEDCLIDVPDRCPQFKASIEANGDEPITSLRLRWSSFLWPKVTATIVNSTLVVSKAWIKVRLKLRDGTTCGNFESSQAWKRAGWTPEPSNASPAFGSEVDLLTAEFPSCGVLKGMDQGALDGATLQVAFSNDCVSACYPHQLGFELVTNEVELGSADPPELKAAGDARDWIPETCVRWVWNYCNKTGRSAAQFIQSGFSLSSGTIDLDDDVDSIVVKFSTAPGWEYQNGANRELGGGMEIVAERGTDTCDASREGYTSSPLTYFIDLSDCLTLPAPGAGPTAGLFTSIDKLTVTFTPEVAPTLLGEIGAEMPRLDHVRLGITSDTNHQVRVAQVTANFTDGTRFRVYGDTNLPMIDLDVNWEGAGETTDVSVFNGGLVINSLLSQGAASAEVGVVCCGPLYPTSQLVAYTEVDATTGLRAAGAPARGVATLRLIPNASPLEAPTPTVTDWQLCSRAGCKLRLRR